MANFSDFITFIYNYIMPPSLLGGIIWAAIQFGRFQKSFEQQQTTLESITPAVSRLNSCVQEIQTVLKNKYAKISLVQETIDIYGIANSPIVLREEYREYLEKSGLATQIHTNKAKIIARVRKQNPKTGLDAQNCIIEMVVNDELDDLLDTKEYKKLLYQSGKTVKDYYSILAIYLFEIIIVDMFPEED